MTEEVKLYYLVTWFHGINYVFAIESSSIYSNVFFYS